MMDEQSFHSLEDYSFFFPVHCLDRRFGLISWSIKEEYQAMFSLLQFSRKMNWAEYLIDLKRSRNVSSLPSFLLPSYFTLLAWKVHPDILPNF